MHNSTLRKLTSITLMAIMVAGGLTFAIPGVMPEAYAKNENLFVSAENSQFNNYVAGPQIVEIVIIDNNLADIDEAVGAPDVTVNGADLQMVQATDGNWYAYMADLAQVRTADPADNGLDYGMIVTEDVPETSNDDLGVALNGPDGYAHGDNTVIRENKEINDNLGDDNLGQVELDAGVWPFIQLYDLTQGGNFVIQYNKAGGAQTTSLTFDTVDDFAGVTLDRTKYPQGGHVHATVTDAWLNIDPTDEDSWTFVDGEMFYQVFDENGEGVNNRPNLESVNGGELMCGDGCDFTVDVATQGNIVMRFDDNSNAMVESMVGNGTTVTEAGPNTGIFTTYDEQDNSMLIITDNAQRGTTATINYAETPQSVLVGFDFASIDIELQDDTWNSGESIPVTLMDGDLNKNTRVDEDITLSDPTFNIIPALRTGTPLTLGTGGGTLDANYTAADGTVTELTVNVDDVSDVGRIQLQSAGPLAESFSLESLADLLSIEMVPAFAQTGSGDTTIDITIAHTTSRVNVTLPIDGGSRTIMHSAIFGDYLGSPVPSSYSGPTASGSTPRDFVQITDDQITLTNLYGGAGYDPGPSITLTVDYGNGTTHAARIVTTVDHSNPSPSHAIGDPTTTLIHQFPPIITSQVDVQIKGDLQNNISIPLSEIFSDGYVGLPVSLTPNDIARTIAADAADAEATNVDTLYLRDNSNQGYSFPVLAYYSNGIHMATINVDVAPSHTPNYTVGGNATNISTAMTATPVTITVGNDTSSTGNNFITVRLPDIFDDGYTTLPIVSFNAPQFTRTIADRLTETVDGRAIDVDSLFTRTNTDDGSNKGFEFTLLALYEDGSMHIATVDVIVDPSKTDAAEYEVGDRSRVAQLGGTEIITPPNGGDILEINLGITGAEFLDAISTDDGTFNGFDLLNYDVRSFGELNENVVVNNLCFVFANSTDDDEMDYCNPTGAQQGLVIIGQSANLTADEPEAGFIGNLDGIDPQGDVILRLEFGGAIDTEQTYPVAVDIFSYGFTDDGVQAAERTANQIIRLELEESGDDTGKFKGTLEYVMLNQLNILDPDTYEITTISDEPTFIVMEDLTDEDSPRVTYADLGGDGVITPISDQQAAPSTSGIVTLNQDSYKIADTVIINVTDADLNVDSDLLEIYTVVRPADHNDTDYDQVGRDMTGDLEALSFGSLGRLLDVTFDDVKWQDTGDRCIDDPDYDDGLGATDFTLRETGADTGVFVGDFQIPAEWCRPGATEPETTTGLDIEVNYVDFRDASGEIIEVGDSAGVRASTGSISLDRTVYPVPFDADDFPLHESVDGALPAGDLQVHIRVNDPDYNVNPSGEDTIAEDLQGPVQISVLRGSDRVILGYAGGETKEGIITTNDTGAGINASRWLGPISEVAPDAGIYELDVTIESTHGPDGIILQGDILQVQYTDPTDASGEPNSVTDSATFDLRNGVLQADKTVYIIGSDMILTIIEPDLNLDSDAAETYDLDLIEWDSDARTTTMGNLGVNQGAAFDPEPSDLRETGDDTGIFQVVVEIPAELGGDRLERGEQIDLEYTDWGPSGADFVGDESEDVNWTVFTSNFGATIELDQKVYTWTDKVYVTIVAPDHNFDSDLIDEIGESPDDPIRVSTRSADIDNYRLVETGTDTGIFTGEVILTGFRHDADGDGADEFEEERLSLDGSGPTDGLLPAGDDDGLTVSFEFSEDETVVGSALIRWNIGEVQWLEASYPASGTGVVRIIDPDMNLNPEAVDNFNVDVWSDSDAGGIDLTVTETNEATGIFEGNVFFTINDDSSGHRLNVAEGDTVTAEYEDRTLPDPYTTADELDITATSLIGTIVPPLERVQVSNLRIVDAFESSLDSISIDQQVQISADLASGQDREQAFAYLVQVQDDNGVTVSLAWIAGSLSPGQSFSPSLSWIPTDAGSYSVTVFVWESVDNPTALSPPVTTSVTVS